MSPIQAAEVCKIFLTPASLKEIFAVSNSAARGNRGKHLFRGKYCNKCDANPISR